MKNYVRSVFKWMFFVAAGTGIGLYANALQFETRTNCVLVALGLAIAFVEGSLKDRIEMLEYRLNSYIGQRPPLD